MQIIWYLLTRADQPPKTPSLFAGIHQTILLSLAMILNRIIQGENRWSQNAGA